MKPKKSKLTARQPARRPKGSLQQISPPEDLHEQIAIRAYELYEWRIRQGALDDDWLQAERDILRDRDMGNSDTPQRGGDTAQEQG